MKVIKLPDFKIEKEYDPSMFICGIDEAGRGPWAGPVVAGAVIFPNLRIDEKLAAELDDSKKLSAAKRENLFDMLQNSGAFIGVGQASVSEIDNLNILQATFLAMKRALESIKDVKADFALIDGNKTPALYCPCRAVIKGDSLSLSISAASIIAKVTRDRIMTELAKEYPEYAWNKNAGYGTKAHITALEKYGITPHHRKTYAPIRKILEGL